jgi:peptidase M50B-like protein
MMPEPTMKQERSRALLVLAGVVTLVAWQFPLGRQALYPFTLLATYAHEMGHGLTALLLGGNFESLEMYANGSGLAHWTGDLGRLGRGLVAAGGLVGPSIAGAAILVASRAPARARILLYAMSVFMALSLIFVARSLFAVVFIGATAFAIAAIARFSARSWFGPFFVQLIAVQLCLAVFRDVSYMFSDGALVDGVLRPSDSAAIADALLLPYWFWGALTAAFSFVVLALGLYLALKNPQKTAPQPA